MAVSRKRRQGCLASRFRSSQKEIYINFQAQFRWARKAGWYVCCERKLQGYAQTPSYSKVYSLPSTSYVVRLLAISGFCLIGAAVRKQVHNQPRNKGDRMQQDFEGESDSRQSSYYMQVSSKGLFEFVMLVRVSLRLKSLRQKNNQQIVLRD